MTDTSPLAPRISDKPTGGSYVEWSAIFAGAIVASAIIVLMTAFGSAIGLSLVSPYKGHSAIVFYIALAIWFIWITVSSFVAGGYIAGRMRRPLEGATLHESHVRDGVHGLVVWAVAVALGTWLATWSISSVVKGGAEVAKSGAASMSSGGASITDPIAYGVDTLLRPSENAPAGKNGAATSSRQAANGTNNEPEASRSGGRTASRQEISRILSRDAIDGSLSSDDHAYLVHAVAARTGLSEADAEKRLDALTEQMKSDTDKARKAGILLAFLTAATLVVGAAAAWWGAGVGGRHRDEKFDASHLTRW